MLMGVLNENGVTDAPRLSEVLFTKGHRTFGSMAALPSNVDAIESSLLFATGMTTFAAIVGPSGWGKTHLIQAACNRIGQDHGVIPEPLATLDYLANPPRFDSHAPLILDDAQESLSRPRMRMILRLNLERRVRGGRPTMLAFTATKVTRQIRALLPSAHDWSISALASAQPAERIPLIHHMASAEGLTLSPCLVNMIAFQMHGNGRTLSGALKRLKLSGSEWVDSVSILRACGLLDPFFSDNSSWDLRLRILKSTEFHRGKLGTLNPPDLALYTMLSICGLSEASAARALGIEPAEAYGRCARFHDRMVAHPDERKVVQQFAELVVEKLAAKASASSR